MDDLDKKEKALLLRGIQSLKTEDCLGESRLGFYLEKRLSCEELAKIAPHLENCLYCLNQLTEMRGLIYLEGSSESLTADQVRNLSKNLFKGKQTEELIASRNNRSSSYSKRTGSFLFPLFEWKYAVSFGFLMLVLSLVSMYVTIKIKNPDVLSRGKSAVLTAAAEKNLKQSSVKVDLLDPSGKNISTIPGVVIDSKGLVLTNLKDLKNADSARVHFTDGSSLPVAGVQVDEARNFAILKIHQKNHVPLKITRPKSLQVGDQFIHIVDPADPAPTASHVTITQVSARSQNDKKEHQYIAIKSQTPLSPKGILVNPEGETVGKIVEGEGMTGSAVIFDFNEPFAPSENFIPISLIGK